MPTYLISYKDVSQFLMENPDCCVFKSGPYLEGFGRAGEAYFYEKLLAGEGGYVRIEYWVNFRELKKDYKAKVAFYAKQSNCGDVVWWQSFALQPKSSFLNDR